MIVREATPDDARRVCRHLRPAERAEQFACRFDDDPAALGEELAQSLPQAIAARTFASNDGLAAALLGAWPVTPRTAGLRMLRTYRWPEVRVGAWRYFLGKFLPGLPAQVGRVQFLTLADHDEMIGIAERIGFALEATLHGIGKHNEDFVMLALLRWPHLLACRQAV
jgi:hypothetical protein